ITEEGYRANLANEGGYKGHHRLLRNVMSSWFIQETKRYYKEHGQDYSFEELGRLAEAAKPFGFLFDPDENLFY
ncbi:rhamnulokinase, partial [[Clostridium] symbiosum]|nr:rhamnulokinase [[Clostridium] symbiosum]